MATNKWLEDLYKLKNTSNALRNILRNKNISCSDSATITTLVNKVNDLAPNEKEESEKWVPDPLWVFPDPNGSNEKKTIEQIYEEDPLASTYTYRAIYMIKGEIDEIDLKGILWNRSNADTFVTSDGSTYSDITDTTLIHKWNKDYDITDTLGNTVRYIKLYTNTQVGYVSSVYRQLIWIIYNLGNISNTSYSNLSYGPDKYPGTCIWGHHYECLDFRGNYTALPAYIYGYHIGFPRCLMYNIDLTTSSGVSGSIGVVQGSSTSSGFGFAGAGKGGCGYVRYITLPKLLPNNSYSHAVTLNHLPNIKSVYIPKAYKSVSFSAYSLLSLKKIIFEEDSTIKTLSLNAGTLYSANSTYGIVTPTDELQFTIPDTVTTLSLVGICHKNINLPASLLSLTLNCCPIIELNIPDTVQTLSLLGLADLKFLSLPSTWCFTKSTSVISFDMYSLEDLVVPNGMIKQLNLSSCINLKKASLINLLTNLADLSADTTQTLTLGATNLAKLTDEEKAIATNKNWTLA